MTDTRHYLRWSAPRSEASPELRSAIRDEQAALPSREQLLNIAAKVQHALDAAPAGNPPAPIGPVALPLAAALGAVALIGVGLLSIALQRPAPDLQSLAAIPLGPALVPTPAPRADAAGDTTRAPQAAALQAHANPQRAADVSPAARAAPRDDVHPQDTTRPARRVRRAVRDSSANPAASSTAPPGSTKRAAELTLLLQARRALIAVPSDALPLLDQHARDYPNGTFTEEREALAIEALSATSARVQAAARARRFLATFPSSAYRRRIAALLGPP